MNAKKRKIILLLLYINWVRKKLEREKAIEIMKRKIEKDGGHPELKFNFPK